MEPSEKAPNPEKHSYSSRIRLIFMRHGEKTGADNVDEIDKGVSLTQHGRQQARERSNDLKTSQTLARSSRRDRAKETALFALAGKDSSITGDESLTELETKADAQLGSRLVVDDRLDFAFKKGSEEHLDLNKAFERGEYFKKIVEKHDVQIKETGFDKGETTYAVQARNIAGIIERYAQIAPRWDELVQDKTKIHEDTLERVLATHGGISESFLLDVIQRLKGEEERNNFVGLFPNGFDYVQGFEVDILTTANEPLKIHLKVKVPKVDGENFVFEEDVSLELLQQIIKDYTAPEENKTS